MFRFLILAVLAAGLFFCQHNPQSLFSYKGKEYKLNDLKYQDQVKIYALYKDFRMRAQKSISNFVIEKEAPQRKIELTEQELRAFYKSKPSLQIYPFSLLEKELRKLYTEEKEAEIELEFLRKFRRKWRFFFASSYTQSPLSTDSRSIRTL